MNVYIYVCGNKEMLDKLLILAFDAEKTRRHLTKLNRTLEKKTKRKQTVHVPTSPLNENNDQFLEKDFFSGGGGSLHFVALYLG